MTAAPALPHGLVEATEPPEDRGIARDAVRMLVTNRATREQSHAHFYDLPSLLNRGDLLVVNDSATLPAALVCRPPLHISTKIDERLWMVEPRGPVASGERVTLPGGGTATMLSPVDPQRPRVWYATFEIDEPMYAYLAKHGTPITYAYLTRTFPLQTYQTIFARTEGSSEMPSAARPFTERVVARLRDNGIAIATITLHCGVASFEHPERPGTERFIVPAETAARVNAARREGHRVVAVGTTVVRALESAASEDGIIASQGWTDLFIDETHQLKSIDALISGFHEATATHLAMLRAFADAPLLNDAYAEAAERGYYYHEFGDIHLIQ
jgi:S-adenosylmethionine:tRNA ribosyltransferase-isomerase